MLTYLSCQLVALFLGFKENICTIILCALCLDNPIFNNKSSIYQGQLMLCPPDSMDSSYQEYPNISTSFGIAAIFFYEEWGGIEVDDSDNPLQEITYYRGNLICQEMGFQQMVPGSIKSLSSVHQYSSYTFNGCTEYR